MSAVDVFVSPIASTKKHSGRSGRGFISVPVPSTRAVPPTMHIGTSAPTISPIAQSSSQESRVQSISSSATMTAAASAEPPPSPAETGIFFLILMVIPGEVISLNSKNAFAALTAVLLSSRGSSSSHTSRMGTSSSSSLVTVTVSHMSTDWVTILSK